MPVQSYYFQHLNPGQVATVTWSGKDAKGKPVGAGYYFFSVQATDRANNVVHLNLGGFRVVPQQPTVSVGGVTLYPGDGKHIVVSLSREALYAYDGNRLVMQTLVTTGNPSLPTPAGHYSIMARYHPYEFISPWPPGSPYWYPPSWSNYAMLFRDGGYFLHDAPWRSAFGPGTNGPGQPGTNYGGTHGCVNIPPGPTLFLWNWAPIGTPVDVVP
jgi:lipoprotein-anchoring transpeptidase ErfK/SrfK